MYGNALIKFLHDNSRYEKHNLHATRFEVLNELLDDFQVSEQDVRIQYNVSLALGRQISSRCP